MAHARIENPFEPVFNEHSRILVLGSFPSVRSREIGFYYSHPQNRFWKMLPIIFNDAYPATTEERRAFALRHGIALWDVLQSCEIVGSSDQSIRNAVPNDIAALLARTGIQRIYLNGQRAFSAYRRFQQLACGLAGVPLPSTSAANASWKLERLAEAWRVVAE